MTQTYLVDWLRLGDGGETTVASSSDSVTELLLTGEGCTGADPTVTDAGGAAVVVVALTLLTLARHGYDNAVPRRPEPPSRAAILPFDALLQSNHFKPNRSINQISFHSTQTVMIKKNVI